MRGLGSAKAHRPQARWTSRLAHRPITRAAPRRLTYALVSRCTDATFLRSLEDGPCKNIRAVSVPEGVPDSVSTLGSDGRVSSAVLTALVASEVATATGANRHSPASIEYPRARIQVDHRFNLGRSASQSQSAAMNRWWDSRPPRLAWSAPEAAARFCAPAWASS